MPTTSFFDAIKSQIQANKPFVLYSDFGKSSIKVMLQQNSKAYKASDFQEKGFVFSPFDSTLPTYLIPSSASKTVEIEATSASFEKRSATELKSDSKIHKNLIRSAIEEIKSTALEKVVLARTTVLEFENCNAIALFLSIAKSYPRAYSYCWFHPKTGFWLGASPETLLKIKDRKVTTMALAGTQVYDGSTQIDWDQKNYEEQEFVTEYLKEELSEHLTDLEVSCPKTIKAGKLLHLQTTLSGRLNSSSDALKNLIFNIHPTPAVCGTPKPLAMHFITQNESIQRAYYSGFLGELNMPNDHQAHQTNLVVNLRCMHLDGNRATLFAGGGITSKSDPDTEWHETEAKLNTIKSALES